MRKITFYIFLGLFSAAILAWGCNNKEEEQQQKQARQDSMAQARQQMQQQRMDSLTAARADSVIASGSKKDTVNKQGDPVFNAPESGMSEKGNYAVQVGAWRSKNKAQQLAEKWVQRGFENAFVVKYGVEKTGDIWFRVRLGKFFTQEKAQNLRGWLQENYQTDSWILYVD